MIIPKNEAETIILFQELAEEMGYEIMSIQSRFPDGVIRSIERGYEFSVEFEYVSSNYFRHGHKIGGCDMIICWKDDMKEKSSVSTLSLFEYMKRKGIGKSKKMGINKSPYYIILIYSIIGIITNFPFFYIVKDNIPIVFVCSLVTMMLIFLTFFSIGKIFKLKMVEDN
jgi:hypothetical protein